MRQGWGAAGVAFLEEVPDTPLDLRWQQLLGDDVFKKGEPWPFTGAQTSPPHLADVLQPKEQGKGFRLEGVWSF